MKRDARALGAAERRSAGGMESGMTGDDLGRFGLRMSPFEVKHNPQFLLRSRPLARVLESLRVMMDSGNNLTIVVGEAGIGKTAAIDAMSREFKDGIRTAYVSDPTLSWSVIGPEIGEKLRLPGGRLAPRAMSADQGVVQTLRVIVDHAERLEHESIQHLGAYLDMKVGGDRRLHRLQVVLAAREVKDAPVFRWLASRAHSRVEFTPLALDETREYVARRVQIAQAAKAQIFSADALDRIAECARGNPRAINLLCAAALNVAASRGSSVVDAETIGTATRRLRGNPTPAPAPASQKAPTQAVASPKVEPKVKVAPRYALLDEPSVSTRVEILERRTERSHAGWAIVCATLLGVIAGGMGFLYFNQPPPAALPAVQIVEIEVEKIVEVPVEVPVEVVKIVRVEVPVKPRPRAPKPRPIVIAKPKKVVPPPAKRAPAPAIALKKPEPPPSAATVLDRAFAKSQPGDHTRLIEILKHGAEGAKLTQTLELARIKRNTRILTVGVLTGDVSNNPREIESRFLSIETGKLEDERFGYRPARGKLEQLKGGRGRDPFYGSSFQYDDFRIRTSKHYVIHNMERTRIEDQHFYAVSAKPRYLAEYERVEFVVDAKDFALVEVHYFKGLGLRPYRIIQYPRSDMKAFGEALVPMRVISRNFQTNQIDEARVVKLALEKALDPKLFTLKRIQAAELKIPNL